MQVDVCQQRTDDTALRRTYFSGIANTIFQNTRFEPLPDEFQNSPVTDPPLEQGHQHGVVYGVKVTLNVSVYHPPTSYQSLLDHRYRLLCAPLRAKAVGVILKVGFKDRFNHHLTCLLYHAVAHRRYSQRSLSAICFRYVDAQYRFRTVSTRFQVLLNLTQKLFDTFPFHVLNGDAILPSATTVSADSFPSLSQNVRPEYAVIERMEPTVPAPFGLQV